MGVLNISVWGVNENMSNAQRAKITSELVKEDELFQLYFRIIFDPIQIFGQGPPVRMQDVGIPIGAATPANPIFVVRKTNFVYRVGNKIIQFDDRFDFVAFEAWIALAKETGVLFPKEEAVRDATFLEEQGSSRRF